MTGAIEAPTVHTVVVEVDQAYAARFPELDTEYAWSLECSDPGACPGWVECTGDHTGSDPEDDTSPAYEQWDDVAIHGLPHDYRYGHGWTVPDPGCPVVNNTSFGSTYLPDEVDMTRAGRWEVDPDWDDTECTLTLIRELAGEPR